MSDGAVELWRRVHETFDPMEPAGADLRVPREGYNPLAERIGPRLRLKLSHQKFVLAGGIGSGKSTELRASAATLDGSKFVVLVDLWQHFEATVGDPGAIDHLQPAELVGLLGLALLRMGRDVLHHDWGEPERRFGQAMQRLSGESGEGAVLNLATLAGGVAVLVGGTTAAAITGPGGALAGAAGAKAAMDGGLKVLEAVTGSAQWNWKIGQRGRKRSSDQDEQVRAVLDATNALLDRLRSYYNRDVVLLVDGLDRVREPSTFEDLFVESSLLRELRCDLVATLELGLVQRFRSRLLWCKAFDFTYVPVADRRAPSAPHAEGIRFFRALAARRFDVLGVEVPLSVAQLERLAYRSGGRLRDFMVLMRELAVQAMLDGAIAVTDGMVEQVVDDLRRERESGLNSEDIRVLQEVADDPDRKLPAGEVALGLLERQLLLAYPNESTWYLPHTLLMMNFVRAGGSIG